MSPVNISVHTTEPELRRMMMVNKRAGEVLSYMNRLADGGIKLRGQIVLCKNVNDGEHLDRTMRDLYALYPAMDSVSVVPAGLTGHREGLYELEDFTPEECAAVIAQVTSFADRCEAECGERIFYVSDEMYVKSGVPLPGYEKWGDFAQIENGVGMLASFDHELTSALAMLTDEDRKIRREVSIATGEAAYKFMCEEVRKVCEEVPGIVARVYCVKNRFFGGHVTVTGLLTATDIADQLKGEELGEALILSSTTLRAEGDMFLDSKTPAELSGELGVPLCFTDADGAEFLWALLGE
jgi:putative radical SAM enzyme (TIGR03279 family)